MCIRFNVNMCGSFNEYVLEDNTLAMYIYSKKLRKPSNY